MNPVIAGQVCGAYPPGMASSLIRLLTLVAAMLMPLGMTAPPAQAMPVAASGHCDEGHGSQSDLPAGPQAHCLGCAALPAADPVEVKGKVRPALPRLISLAAAIEGSDPETATPPPKHF